MANGTRGRARPPRRADIGYYREYREQSIQLGIPEHYGTSVKMLYRWQRLGWLGLKSVGSGYRYPWTDPEVAARIRWLVLLDSKGLFLNDADTVAGVGLRQAGRAWAVRDGNQQWWGLDEPWPIPAHIPSPWVIVNMAHPALAPW